MTGFSKFSRKPRKETDAGEGAEAPPPQQQQQPSMQPKDADDAVDDFAPGFDDTFGCGGGFDDTFGGGGGGFDDTFGGGVQQEEAGGGFDDGMMGDDLGIGVQQEEAKVDDTTTGKEAEESNASTLVATAAKNSSAGKAANNSNSTTGAGMSIFQQKPKAPSLVSRLKSSSTSAFSKPMATKAGGFSFSKPRTGGGGGGGGGGGSTQQLAAVTPRQPPSIITVPTAAKTPIPTVAGAAMTLAGAASTHTSTTIHAAASVTPGTNNNNNKNVSFGENSVKVFQQGKDEQRRVSSSFNDNSSNNNNNINIGGGAIEDNINLGAPDPESFDTTTNGGDGLETMEEEDEPFAQETAPQVIDPNARQASMESIHEEFLRNIQETNDHSQSFQANMLDLSVDLAMSQGEMLTLQSAMMDRVQELQVMNQQADDMMAKYEKLEIASH